MWIQWNQEQNVVWRLHNFSSSQLKKKNAWWKPTKLLIVCFCFFFSWTWIESISLAHVFAIWMCFHYVLACLKNRKLSPCRIYENPVRQLTAPSLIKRPRTSTMFYLDDTIKPFIQQRIGKTNPPLLIRRQQRWVQSVSPSIANQSCASPSKTINRLMDGQTHRETGLTFQWKV